MLYYSKTVLRNNNNTHTNTNTTTTTTTTTTTNNNNNNDNNNKDLFKKLLSDWIDLLFVSSLVALKFDVTELLLQLPFLLSIKLLQNIENVAILFLKGLCSIFLFLVLFFFPRVTIIITQSSCLHAIDWQCFPLQNVLVLLHFFNFKMVEKISVKWKYEEY